MKRMTILEFPILNSCNSICTSLRIKESYIRREKFLICKAVFFHGNRVQKRLSKNLIFAAVENSDFSRA